MRLRPHSFPSALAPNHRRSSLKADMIYTDFFKARTDLVKALAKWTHQEIAPQWGKASSGRVTIANAPI
jgi:hypothetical protein